MTDHSPDAHYEKLQVPAVGIWWDEIYKRNPDTGEITLIEKTQKTCNTIAINFGLLVAALLKIEGGFTGITFHTVGSGLVAWDTVPFVAVSSQTALENEVIRNAPDIIQFLDGSDLPTATVTNKIEIKTTFDFADGPGGGFFIREQALFGGDATGAADSGQMLNAINQTKTFKDSNIRIIKFITLEIDVP